MDESHRLKDMPIGYDKALFSQLYKETKSLRLKLAWEIDSRKFGVDYDEILSWFDVKFIYAFTKYYGDERLKGYIINALRTLKMHIVKNSYQLKHQMHGNKVDIEEVYDLAMEPVDEHKDNLMAKVRNYFKLRLSEDAYFLWELELNPPPYILSQIPSDKKIPKLTNDVILAYLGIEVSTSALNYLAQLRSEVKIITKQAKDYFSLKPIN